MAEVWSIIIWLKDGAGAPDEETLAKIQQNRAEGAQPPNHRTRVFNPPALQRVHYGHYRSRDDAESVLQELAEELAGNEPMYINKEEHAFLIPAHSIYYLALGKADGYQEGMASGMAGNDEDDGE